MCKECGKGSVMYKRILYYSPTKRGGIGGSLENYTKKEKLFECEVCGHSTVVKGEERRPQLEEIAYWEECTTYERGKGWV